MGKTVIMVDEVGLLEKRVAELEKEIAVLEKNLGFFTKPSDAALYYAVKRKCNEMAELLNSRSLSSCIGEGDKTFERMRFIWNDAKGLVIDTKLLGEAVGITGDEIRDMAKTVSFLDSNAT